MFSVWVCVCLRWRGDKSLWRRQQTVNTRVRICGFPSPTNMNRCYEDSVDPAWNHRRVIFSESCPRLTTCMFITQKKMAVCLSSSPSVRVNRRACLSPWGFISEVSEWVTPWEWGVCVCVHLSVCVEIRIDNRKQPHPISLPSSVKPPVLSASTWLQISVCCLLL